MFVVAFFAILAIFQTVFGAPQGDRLRFSDRREPENSEYRTFNRRGSYSGSGSSIEDVFKIPIAVIKGTSAAAQVLSPQNTQAIQSIFDIPVTTLDAVGNYIKESRPQRISNNNNNNFNNNNNNNFDNDNNNNAQNFGTRRPLSLSDQRRQERRERILRMREQERDRRKVMDEERFFQLGHHSSLNLFSSLADFLVGGGGHHTGNLFGSHDQGHQWKPPKRPLRPSKPGHHGGHGSVGSSVDGNSQYAVHEQVNERPIHSGIFSWLQTGTSPQFDGNEIQNKIAPGSEFRINPERAEFRVL